VVYSFQDVRRCESSVGTLAQYKLSGPEPLQYADVQRVAEVAGGGIGTNVYQTTAGEGFGRIITVGSIVNA
jgi:hypothetical protein